MFPASVDTQCFLSGALNVGAETDDRGQSVYPPGQKLHICSEVALASENMLIIHRLVFHVGR